MNTKNKNQKKITISTKLSRGKKVLLTASTLVILTMVVIGSSSLFSAMMAGTVSGKVFQDYNGNGVYDTSGTIENLFGGVTVTVYDSAGAVQGTATTTATADGGGNNFSIATTGTGPYRVEFTNIPTYLKPGVFGTGAGTTVQFVNEGGATNVNLGLTDPGKFNNEANPATATTIFLNGQYNAAALNGITSLVRTPYDATGHDFTGTTPTAGYEGVELAEIQETGAIYGMAWQSTRDRVYVGSYHKRYSGFGANGPDAIYVFNKAGTTIGTIDLDTLIGSANSAGTDAHDFTATGGIVYDIGTGNASYDGVGKRSLGDIDMSGDQKTLFVVNLFDRRIYAINVASGTPSGATLIKSWAAPDATTASRHRPFALAWRQGRLWVGSVDQNGTNAYVHSMTPNLSSPTGSEPFTLETTVPLNYVRQSYQGTSATDATRVATWRAWSTDPAATTYLTNGGGEIAFPQPMLSDIEFDETGSMILGFRDRFGDQTGSAKRFRPSDGANTWGVSAGDILRVCRTATSFVVEGSAGCATSGGLNNSGPGGAASPEHYNWDIFEDGGTWDTTTSPGGAFHWETAQGSLVQLAGRATTLTTAMDPNNDYGGGYLRLTNSTGRREGINTDGATTQATILANGGYTLYESGDFAGGPPTSLIYFGKANGLGDVEALTNPPPIEIGNRLWRDTNSNGRQDPNEAVLANVLVGLYNASGVLISTVETNAAGQYLFSSSTTATDVNADADATPEYDYGLTALTPETAYTVAILNSNFNSGNPLAGLIRTTPNSIPAGTTTNNDAITDIRDSDGVILATGVGTGANAAGLGTAFTTGTVGSANHSFDFGFVAPVSIGSTVFNDLNRNGSFDTGETGIGGVLVELLYDADNDGDIEGSELTTPIASINTSSVAGSVGNYFFNGLIPGNYQVRIPTPPTGLELSSVVTDAADNQQDNDDNGIQTGGAGASTISPLINLTPGAEPLNANEGGQGGTQDDSTTDADGDMTVDFGFVVPTYSLGNRIWFDTNNNGQIDSGEVGISNVLLTLLDSANNPVDDPNQAGTQNYTVTTDANGYYRFDNLPAGTYKVRVNATNFIGGDADTTDALVGYQNTTGNTAGDLDSTATLAGEDGINPTGAANTVQTGGILSNVITLGLTEPIGETDVAGGTPAGQGTVDNLANMTVDFGFYRLNLSGTVWLDTGAGANNNNGILDAGEARMPNAVVLLYDSAGVEIPVGYDGILGTEDDALGGMQTDASGNYLFQGLPPGTYRVGVNTARTGTSSTFTAADTNLNADNDDDGGVNASFPQRVVSGTIVLTPGGEPTVTQATGTTLNTTVDFGFIVAPTLVTLENFDVLSDGDSATIKWATASEDANLGFNVYREVGGKRELLNASPIIGTALRSRINLEAKSAGYSWTDIEPVENAVYYLEDIDMKGRRTVHGPVTPVMQDSGLGRSANSKLLSDLRKLTKTMKQTDSIETGKTAAKAVANAAGNTRQQFEIAAREGVKIAVKNDGWYRISRGELQTAGFDVNSNPTNWQMFADGEELPFRFAENGAVEFYGSGLDRLETDKQTYYLTVGTTAGQRLPEETATEVEKPNNADSFRNAATIKDRTIYLVGVLNGDEGNWFGALVYQGEAANYDLAINNRYNEGQARLKVKLQGLSDLGHAVNLRFNNFDLGALNFEGYNNQAFEFDVPMSAVLEGNNRITLSGIGDADDLVSVDEVGLTYERRFTARDNKLTFRVPAGNTVEVGGFSDANISVVELNNGRAVRRLAVQSAQTENGFAFGLNAASSDREFIAFTDSQANAPASIVRNTSSRWNSANNSGQFLIIAPEQFREAATNLANVRQQEGFKTQVVAVEDIYDEFSFGATSVAAVRELLRNASQTWKVTPKFILLFGDASYDMRNYLAQPDRNLVPTKLIDTETFETSSDAWIADFNDDGIEDISLGRLPAGTETEATRMIEKITRQPQAEDLREQKTNLFVTDSGFDADADALRQILPANVGSNVIRRSELGIPQMRGEIIAQTNAGQSVITYMGHGSSIAWSSSGFFRTTDTPSLKNDKLSFYLLMTCLNGYSVDPGNDSLAESLIKADNGAFAVWVSSGATRVYGQTDISRAATDLIFNRTNKPLRIGDIARLAKLATQDGEIRRTWQLIGDPTMFVK